MVQDPSFAYARLARITGANEEGSLLTVAILRPQKKWRLQSELDGKPYLDLEDERLNRLVHRFLVHNLRAVGQKVIEEQGNKCAVCHHLKPLEIDHVVSRAKERDDRRPNLVGLCRDCHDEKHGKLQWSRSPSLLKA